MCSKIIFIVERIKSILKTVFVHSSRMHPLLNIVNSISANKNRMFSFSGDVSENNAEYHYVCLRGQQNFCDKV